MTISGPIGLWLRGALAALLLALIASPADATSRIKDISDFEGVRENLLIGYGLVVGLNGTGDSLNNSAFTQQSLVGMLERLGVNTRDANIQTNNVAAVIVTATLPAFARHGARIDVTVSALGDASNLLGGTLLVTPLLGADGEVYAVSQGQIAVAGFSAEGQSGTSITKGVPTSGRISSGAIIEREIEFALSDLPSVNIALRNPDFTTARRVAQAINAALGDRFAAVTDPGTVQLRVPDAYGPDVAGLITDIEQIEVQPDTIARVVIDEASGVIVMGDSVRIDTVAIAHGNLTIRITETPQVSQPGAFAPEGATTEIVDRTEIEVDEGDDNGLLILNPGVSLQDLVAGLNSLGIGTRDMMTILQTIKAAGALQAEIEVL
jgi:flagellar P-ring protein precursor FlgI